MTDANANANDPRQRESADAQTVNTAVELIVAGDFDQAEQLLVGVLANTPREYTHTEENAEGVSIQFWDQERFLHYVTWQRTQGLADRNITWAGNAYPRAHYYMGFISVKRKQFERAIAFLDKGQTLEPTNPMFVFEKAQALFHSGRKREALALYEQVTQLSPHVSGHDLARARRGRGFVLVELGDLDGAEAAFVSSLEFEPDNKIALHELRYVQHLRQGGAASIAQVVPSTVPGGPKCAACGNPFEKGIVVSMNGMPVSICKRCERKLTKKWWQFWK